MGNSVAKSENSIDAVLKDKGQFYKAIERAYLDLNMAWKFKQVPDDEKERVFAQCVYLNLNPLWRIHRLRKRRIRKVLRCLLVLNWSG
jgi:hypothetical protein